jgi:Zn finger protein HypA/HybF involved in hydrogenase expression
MKLSKEGKVWVETDMRAHMNPSRMKAIEELAVEFAKRLSVFCPKCNTPGWGKVGYEKGLSCADCGLKTEVINMEIAGCPKCDYQEKLPPAHGLLQADPSDCLYCNP